MGSSSSKHSPEEMAAIKQFVDSTIADNKVQLCGGHDDEVSHTTGCRVHVYHICIMCVP